ncbi:Uncharacterised protein, partial [Mycoplasma putrefaciens]
MKKAGLLRRILTNLIDGLLTIVTLGIYLVVRIVLFLQGKPTVGMKAANLNYSSPNRMLSLFGFYILESLFFIVTLGIGIIIDFVRIILKKGTFAEKW